MMYREKISCFVIDRITDWFVIISCLLGIWLGHSAWRLDPACLLDMLFGWILSLCVDDPDPSYAYGDAGEMGVWMSYCSRYVLFGESRDQLYSAWIHVQEKSSLLKASYESSIREKLNGKSFQSFIFNIVLQRHSQMTVLFWQASFWLFVILFWIGCYCHSGLVTSVLRSFQLSHLVWRVVPRMQSVLWFHSMCH